MTRPAMLGVKLEPYDQGYRDGRHDIHVTRRKRRRKRRERNAEYALGYGHGRIDGDHHPDYPDWWPDYARGSLRFPHVSRPSSHETARKTPEATKDWDAA